MHPTRRHRAALALAVAAGSVGGVLAASPSATAADCPQVQLIWARGTGEPAGLGGAGTRMADALRTALAGRTLTTTAVDYPASADQSGVGAGATDLTSKLEATANRCAGTQFVLGGHSQGASVTDVALGINTIATRGSTGRAIPASLAPRVAAVVVFGNPMRRWGGGGIPDLSPTYAARALDLCNAGDPVCSTGADGAAHVAYLWDGSIQKGASFAVAHLSPGTPAAPASTSRSAQVTVITAAPPTTSAGSPPSAAVPTAATSTPTSPPPAPAKAPAKQSSNWWSRIVSWFS